MFLQNYRNTSGIENLRALILLKLATEPAEKHWDVSDETSKRVD